MPKIVREIVIFLGNFLFAAALGYYVMLVLMPCQTDLFACAAADFSVTVVIAFVYGIVFYGLQEALLRAWRDKSKWGSLISSVLFFSPFLLLLIPGFLQINWWYTPLAISGAILLYSLPIVAIRLWETKQDEKVWLAEEAARKAKRKNP